MSTVSKQDIERQHQLDVIEAKLAPLVSLSKTLDDIRDELKLYRELLTGNGDPTKGLIVRVDRLEMVTERNKWAIRTVGAACISAIVGLIRIFISKGN